MALTEKEQLFCKEYPVDFNGARAAIAAGYSAKGAGVRATKLLAKPEIRKAMSWALKRRMDALDLKAEDVIRELMRIGFRDAADFCDENGHLIGNLRSLPEDVRRSIDGIEQEERTYRDQDGGEHTTVKTKLKLVGKLGALELLAKHLKLLQPDVINDNRQQVFVNWDDMYERAGEVIEVPKVEERADGQGTGDRADDKPDPQV